MFANVVNFQPARPRTESFFWENDKTTENETKHCMKERQQINSTEEDRKTFATKYVIERKP